MPDGDYNRKREPFPSIPFIFLQTRDILWTWSTNSYMYWNVESVKTSDFDYTINESKVFVLTSGYYELTFEASVVLESGSLNYVIFTFFKNGSQLKGSEVINELNIAESVSLHYYTYLKRGDYIQVYSVVGDGGGTVGVLGNTMRLAIKGLSMEGWNNGRGGN